ncbi:hypothetical protein CBL_04275 [Carabus blaptoides fortunei]
MYVIGGAPRSAQEIRVLVLDRDTADKTIPDHLSSGKTRLHFPALQTNFPVEREPPARFPTLIERRKPCLLFCTALQPRTDDGVRKYSCKVESFNRIISILATNVDDATAAATTDGSISIELDMLAEEAAALSRSHLC